MRLTELVHQYQGEIRTSRGKSTPQAFFRAIAQSGFGGDFYDFVEAERMIYGANAWNFHRINVGLARAYVFHHRQREEMAFQELKALYDGAAHSEYLQCYAKKTLYFIMRNEEKKIRRQIDF